MASIIAGISSFHHQSSALELSRRHLPSLSLEKLPLGGRGEGLLKACSKGLNHPFSSLRISRHCPCAIATPNSVLSEEAFKDLGGLSNDVKDDDYASRTDGEQASEDGLAIADLGLPQQLVESLEKRGITHLFPIQVKTPHPRKTEKKILYSLLKWFLSLQ